MEESVYRPSELALQSQTSHRHGGQGYGALDLGKCFEHGIKAVWQQIGAAFGVGFLHSLLAYITIVFCFLLLGLFLFPLVVSGYHLAGLAFVRRQSPLSGIFEPFRFFGRHLLASLLFAGPIIVIAAVVIAVVALIMTMVGYGAESGALEGEAGAAAALGIGLVYLLAIGMSFLGSLATYYIWGRWVLVTPLIQEREFAVLDAFRESWRVTGPYQWHLMILSFGVTQLPSLGMLLCGVGFFPAVSAGMAVYGAAAVQLLGEELGLGGAGSPPPSVAPATG